MFIPEFNSESYACFPGPCAAQDCAGFGTPISIYPAYCFTVSHAYTFKKTTWELTPGEDSFFLY